MQRGLFLPALYQTSFTVKWREREKDRGERERKLKEEGYKRKSEKKRETEFQKTKVYINRIFTPEMLQEQKGKKGYLGEGHKWKEKKTYRDTAYLKILQACKFLKNCLSKKAPFSKKFLEFQKRLDNFSKK